MVSHWPRLDQTAFPPRKIVKNLAFVSGNFFNDLTFHYYKVLLLFIYLFDPICTFLTLSVPWKSLLQGDGLALTSSWSDGIPTTLMDTDRQGNLTSTSSSPKVVEASSEVSPASMVDRRGNQTRSLLMWNPGLWSLNTSCWGGRICRGSDLTSFLTWNGKPQSSSWIKRSGNKGILLYAFVISECFMGCCSH